MQSTTQDELCRFRHRLPQIKLSCTAKKPKLYCSKSNVNERLSLGLRQCDFNLWRWGFALWKRGLDLS